MIIGRAADDWWAPSGALRVVLRECHALVELGNRDFDADLGHAERIECVALDIEGHHLSIADLDTLRVVTCIEFASHRPISSVLCSFCEHAVVQV